MKKMNLNAEPYEAPMISCLMAEVEMGFTATSVGNAGSGGFGSLGDEDFWNSSFGTGEDLDYEEY